mgnify:CR=1 FL=1
MRLFIIPLSNASAIRSTSTTSRLSASNLTPTGAPSPSNKEIASIQDIIKKEIDKKKEELRALFMQVSQSQGLRKIIAKNGGIKELQKKINNGRIGKIDVFLKDMEAYLILMQNISNKRVLKKEDLLIFKKNISPAYKEANQHISKAYNISVNETSENLLEPPKIC